VELESLELLERQDPPEPQTEPLAPPEPKALPEKLVFKVFRV
jgi:hypothetical protein